MQEPHFTFNLHMCSSIHRLQVVLHQGQGSDNKFTSFSYRILLLANNWHPIMELWVIIIVWELFYDNHYVLQVIYNHNHHHSLFYFCNIINHFCRFARWILKTQNFNYTIVYLPRNIHQEPDCIYHHRRPTQVGRRDGNNDAYIFAFGIRKYLPY